MSAATLRVIFALAVHAATALHIADATVTALTGVTLVGLSGCAHDFTALRGCWLTVAVAKQISASMYECLRGPIFRQWRHFTQEQ